MQQDVKVQIERIDPGGTFQGKLAVGPKKQDLAMLLLEKGNYFFYYFIRHILRK